MRNGGSEKDKMTPVNKHNNLQKSIPLSFKLEDWIGTADLISYF